MRYAAGNACVASGRHTLRQVRHGWDGLHCKERVHRLGGTL